ncbi:hypothetical protein ACHAXA_011193 [Cyclostephanos tholiformis]|uniref:Uncharacterized protein n=1 Tax=Cyclostephanos tholiformis TaxID=382380 RepID=A0ABD3R964_9STRA
MRSTSSIFLCILVAAVSAGPSTAFVPTGPSSLPISSMHAGNDDEGGMPSTAAVDDARARVGGGSPIGSIEKFRIPNPLAELVDIFSNFDDVVDDFFNKRMGNGEVFYGKRKYKPSGKVSSEYNGGGFTDFRKIEAAREFREMRAMMREGAGKEKEGR